MALRKRIASGRRIRRNGIGLLDCRLLWRRYSVRRPALDTVTRSQMEQRFGHDFGQVRIDTDERASERP